MTKKLNTFQVRSYSKCIWINFEWKSYNVRKEGELSKVCLLYQNKVSHILVIQSSSHDGFSFLKFTKKIRFQNSDK